MTVHQQINKSMSSKPLTLYHLATNQPPTMNDPKYIPQILAKDAFSRADTKMMTYFCEKLTK